MKKAMVIINPSSGKEKSRQYLPHLQEVLQPFYNELAIKETQKEGDAVSFAKEACMNKYEAVITMGGDGTISETINGLGEQEHVPALGIIPFGTINDFARALHIPLEPIAAIDLLSKQFIKEVDIGKINNGYFMNVLAIGAIAEASYTVTADQKTKLGPIAYFVEGVKALIRKTPFEFRIEHDSGAWEGKAYLMVAALTNSVGGFESLEPNAEVNDGKLHVFIIKEISFQKIFKIIPSLLKGELKHNDQVEYIRTSRLAVTSPEKLAVNIDGDEGVLLPIQVQVLKNHLSVFVPPLRE
ncbi:diacylglycerol kinase family lipid kinase [Peribacillus saganii]|uniref:Diacylglycerol kinase family lipid kinase n=1 Tax=Peribacillus saganii TaxID=2303992 RepID=A0A372LL05_9BACI|nr:diacylglycerol kinase family protein [Peribacillus saganii]RFU67392.1 diacylglycerol kinase family lipid kinase [Peribacillus saganii]